MDFINPIEVLELSNLEISDIDIAVIKKAKRRVIADIELSDTGYYQYGDAEYTKSDIEHAIDLIADKEKLEFYHFIANQHALNNFLKNSAENSFVDNFRQESIYRLEVFVHFISPFYAKSFEQFITRAFKNNELAVLRASFKIPELYTIADRSSAYKGIEQVIKKNINHLDELTKGIREGKTNETHHSISKNAERLKNVFSSDKLNLLPNHFQSLKNQVAQSIRNLSVQLHNHFGLTELALSTISYALTIDVDGLTAQKLKDDRQTINDLHQQLIENKKNEPHIKKYSGVATFFLELKKRLSEKKIGPKQLVSALNHPDFKGLNNSPEALWEIRDEIAIILRSISVDIWNDYNDIQSAIAVIRLAVGIKMTPATRENIIKAEKELGALFDKHKHELFCFFCGKSEPTESVALKKMVYKESFRQYKKVQYSYKEISVPRCSPCAQIHTEGNNTKVLYAVVITAICTFLGYLADEHYLIGAILGIIGGILYGANQSEQKIKSKNIKTVAQVSQFQPINEMLRAGWSFEKPSA